MFSPMNYEIIDIQMTGGEECIKGGFLPSAFFEGMFTDSQTLCRESLHCSQAVGSYGIVC